MELAMDGNLWIELTVNGSYVKRLVPRKKSLADFIRDDLQLTGTKKGCTTGDCGSCVVLIDGKPKTTCNLPAYKADGSSIVTIEGIAEGNELSVVQKAFISSGAIQCGYCTPGMVLEATALLNHHSKPSEDVIKEAISGHICRCTGYLKIVEAILAAAEKLADNANHEE
jgi:aerobic carbon-monoxide dehydrogenase small subunit